MIKAPLTTLWVATPDPPTRPTRRTTTIHQTTTRTQQRSRKGGWRGDADTSEKVRECVMQVLGLLVFSTFALHVLPVFRVARTFSWHDWSAVPHLGAPMSTLAVTVAICFSSCWRVLIFRAIDHPMRVFAVGMASVRVSFCALHGGSLGKLFLVAGVTPSFWTST